MVRQFLNVLIQVAILAISFITIYQLSLYAEDPEKVSSEQKDSIPIVIAIIIAVLNGIFDFVLQCLSEYERHYTIDELLTSIVRKSCLIQYLNSAAIAFVVKSILGSIVTHKTGLLYQQILIFFVITLAPITVELVAPFYILKKVQQWFYTR